ncbi:peptide/nickel transport system ATP-binding protein/oligopeptide transport system ATP-binding protein [Jannaschia faecimaris]|uniref:Peptide/nickel transport system ATP-binding protein/oligopeptide transport system ATP-binding protein n=1 Tax=Jannaschia faecimaris TaxID=1244108 RepID=A0A1H3P6E7_9RHOB|nr:oligopeptide/dipeptide ABC transporter ATP-binding protein [Jannaschia faecimaris]SDY96543.1 peptide/nickel transport system ATP-binding protein/oligopeptide transport system ATP-binding protein [Jannaschia faecimaris]
MTLLRIEDLKVHFPVRTGRFGGGKGLVKAVDGVSLTVNVNETVAVVGESGCGKSTTGNAVLGLAPITAGRITFDDRDIATLSEAERRHVWREMQVVFQDPVSALNPRRTIAQSIGEPLVIHRHPKDQIAARVDELMDLVGLNPDQRDRRPGALSGGQRQRVVIARALALNPRLIICDEPVSALDVSIQSQILNLLMRLQRELGLSYLFIAHDLSVVRHIADRVAVMYLGVVVEEGPASEVFANPMHPYTEALLSAIPLPDPKLRDTRKRIVLEGDMPSPLDPPTGCPFVTRCPIAEAACGTARPDLAEFAPGHMVRCPPRLRSRD